MTFNYLKLSTTIFTCCIIAASLVLSSCSNDANTQQTRSSSFKNSEKDSVYIESEKDHKNGKLKYYYSGIASCPPELAEYMIEHYNIEVVNKIDIAEINTSYYNEFTDSVLYSKSGKRFADLYNEIK